MNTIALQNKTMSSLEIAELTGKNHKEVIRDIRAVLKQAEIEDAQFCAPFKMPSGQNTTVYNLPKRECDLVVSGYSVKYRLKIIDRWQELEAKEQPLSLKQMTLQVMTELQAKVDEQQEQIETKNQLIIASNEASIKAGKISIREFVKSNDAINIGGNKFIEWLRENCIIMKNSRQPLQLYADKGWLTWKFSKEDINGRKRRELKITPRGQLQLAKRYMQFRSLKLEQLEAVLE